MTNEELEKKAEESYWNSDVSGSFSSKKCYILGFIACAKELRKEISETENALDMFLEENEHLKRDNGLLAKRICELQSDLSREKSKNEKLIEELKNEKAALKQKEDEIKELKEVIKNLRCLENK